MSVFHLLLALFVAFTWGMNFVMVKISYDAFPPFLLLSIRFIFTVFPLIFFIPKPKASWKDIILIALFLWVLQFSFLYVGMYIGAGAGLSSLLIQTQTIFTVIFSVLWLGYQPTKKEIIGLSIAFIGIIGIAHDQFNDNTLAGILMVIAAALSVSVSNILFNKTKQKTDDHPLSMVVWTSLIPPIPMLLASFYFEGTDAIIKSWHAITWASGSALVYTIYVSTLLSTTAWVFLLQRHNPSQVVPYTLLIPVTGMGGSYLILGEVFTPFSLASSLVVILGLAYNQWSRKRVPRSLPLRKVV